MCCGRLGSLYLDEALGADCLIATARVVYVGRVVLRSASTIEEDEKETTDEEADWTLDGAPVESGLWAA